MDKNREYHLKLLIDGRIEVKRDDMGELVDYFQIGKFTSWAYDPMFDDDGQMKGFEVILSPYYKG